MKQLSTGQKFDESRGLLITNNTHDTGQTQQHVSMVKADQLHGMSEQDIEYIFLQVKNHMISPETDSDLLIKKYKQNKRRPYLLHKGRRT